MQSHRAELKWKLVHCGQDEQNPHNECVGSGPSRPYWTHSLGGLSAECAVAPFAHPDSSHPQEMSPHTSHTARHKFSGGRRNMMHTQPHCHIKTAWKNLQFRNLPLLSVWQYRPPWPVPRPFRRFNCGNKILKRPKKRGRQGLESDCQGKKEWGKAGSRLKLQQVDWKEGRLT